MATNQHQAGATVFFERGRTWTLTSDAEVCAEGLLAKATRDPNPRFPDRGPEEYVILDRYERLTDGTYRIIDFLPRGATR